MKQYITPKANFIPVEINDIIATSSVSFYSNYGEDEMGEEDVQ